MAADQCTQDPPNSDPRPTQRRRRPPRTALALVLHELDNLPAFDDRYRLWPWSLRAIAHRRGTSPSTVHKHIQALRDAGVLVEDESQPGRTLVDVARLEALTRPAEPRPVSPALEPATSAGGTSDHLLRAIDLLSTVAEARPELVDGLAEIIGRLVHLLAEIASTSPVPAPGRAPQAGDKARDRAPSSEDRKRDLCRSTFVSLSRRRARRAPNDRAREARGGAIDRTAAQLFELLAPLDPARHVTCTEGALAALASYSDDQIRYAVARAATSPATDPVGLLVDRANCQDPAYFPRAAPRPTSPSTSVRRDDCRCGGAGVVPVDDSQSAYLPCPGDSSELLAS